MKVNLEGSPSVQERREALGVMSTPVYLIRLFTTWASSGLAKKMLLQVVSVCVWHTSLGSELILHFIHMRRSEGRQFFIIFQMWNAQHVSGRINKTGWFTDCVRVKYLLISCVFSCAQWIINLAQELHPSITQPRWISAFNQSSFSHRWRSQSAFIWGSRSSLD